MKMTDEDRGRRGQMADGDDGAWGADGTPAESRRPPVIFVGHFRPSSSSLILILILILIPHRPPGIGPRLLTRCPGTPPSTGRPHRTGATRAAGSSRGRPGTSGRP